MHVHHRLVAAAVRAIVVGGIGLAAPLQAQESDGGWRYFGGDEAFTRYSPLAQITRDNVGQLEVAWRRPGVDPGLAARLAAGTSVSSYLKGTPIIIDGVLYAPNALGLVEAFDPATGGTIWIQSPLNADELRAAPSRGVAYWSAGSDRRLISVRGEYLYALDPRTGSTYSEFGEGGRVNLRGSEPNAPSYGWGCGPIVVGDVVVLGGTRAGTGDRSPVRERPASDVRGYDVRTGRLLWTFHVVPREGEFGTETWGEESWRYAGDSGSWTCLSGDDELGYVYLPLSAPTGRYGGWRPGDNLFSNSLVAVDVRTGERVWHFQIVHHGLGDYENASAPVLGDITVDGRRIQAVILPYKNGFLYTFDRVTGEPVWPIVERPVPRSTVPGEHDSPTQPFPTKPPAIEMQGMSPEHLIDITPELHAEALEFLERFTYGPLYTPPSEATGEGGKEGTLRTPMSWGGGNWHTAAFDPETGILYASTPTQAQHDVIAPAADPTETIGYLSGGTNPVFLPRSGLPPIKPPWGRLTAVDMNRGEILWMMPNGMGPHDHPALRDLEGLGALGYATRPAPLVTKTLVFLGEGSDLFGGQAPYMWGTKFRAYDKATGEWIWDIDLENGTTSGPMTYLHEGRQYIVVPSGSSGTSPEWVALALPRMD